MTKVDRLSDQSESLDKLFLSDNQLTNFDDIDKNPLYKEGDEFFQQVKASIKNIVRIA